MVISFKKFYLLSKMIPIKVDHFLILNPLIKPN